MKILTTSYITRGRKFILNYSLDKRRESSIEIDFPFKLDKVPEILLSELGYACTSIISSLTVPKIINMDFALRKSKNYQKVINIIYESRFYDENKNIFYPKLNYSKRVFATKKPKNHRKALLSFSGGLDSSYSLILLKKNNYLPITFSTNININQWNAERKAIEKISKICKVKNIQININFPRLIELGRETSDKFNKFPTYNAIPWGRDLLHIFIGQVLAWENNYNYMCLGNEFEVWLDKAKHKGKIIWKKEIQGEKANILLNSLLKKSGLHLFSPISGLKKYYIYHHLRKDCPKVFNNFTSCFFGDKCNKCLSCSLYRLMEKIYLNLKPNTKTFLLKTKKITHRNTFAEPFYYFHWDSINKNVKNKEYANKLRQNYGTLIGKSKEEVYSNLMKTYKTKLIPANFRMGWYGKNGRN